MSPSKEKPGANPEGQGALQQKRSKDKLIRLDDLLPDDDKVVGGGGKRLFGATESKNENPKTTER